MSLLLSRSSLYLGKPVLVRSSRLHSNGFSSSLLQTPPFSIMFARPCGNGLGKPVIWYANEYLSTYLEKNVPLELVDDDNMENIGSSHSWIATLKDDGVVRLHDDLNPVASDSNPKRISLPPLVTLPRCQTQIVTNVAMSSSSPEEEDCDVAIKFLGNQLSFCRPAQTNPEWINIKIQNPCFFSSPVMFSKKDDMFRIPGSGGHIIGSWDPRTYQHKPKLQKLRFRNLPDLSKTTRELLDSCFRSEHLVESPSTGETFLVKWYKKTRKIKKRVESMRTEALMVFKVDEKGNAVYTEDIGDLCIFLSRSEPFCVPASSFPGMTSNEVHIFDFYEFGMLNLADYTIDTETFTDNFGAPYHIPPQNIH